MEEKAKKTKQVKEELILDISQLDEASKIALIQFYEFQLAQQKRKV